MFVCLRYYPPEKQGLRQAPCYSMVARSSLRYYPPEKQGLRQDEPCIGAALLICLRYYPPEKQGLRQTANLLTTSAALRYYPPEKQGLRPERSEAAALRRESQILSSRKTRIKTYVRRLVRKLLLALRYYPPEKQGLRLVRKFFIFGREPLLRYYPPEKQGLGKLADDLDSPLRYYPPEKQGLRRVCTH